MTEEYKQVAPKEVDDIVDATIIPFDGIEETLRSAHLVRVVAPCDLPANYKLLVKAGNGETFEVVVPKCKADTSTTDLLQNRSDGVYRNETFEAEEWRPNPIEGHFGDDLFNCGSEGNWFFAACCCGGLALGRLMENLQLTWCATRSKNRPQNTFAIVAVLWFVYYVFSILDQIRTINSLQYPEEPPSNLTIVGLIIYILCIYLIVIMTKTRMAFRSKYKIPGDCCTDCLVSYFCGCCANLQMYRHMKRSGDRPTPWTSPVEAEIV